MLSTTNEVQTLNISDLARGSGYYTLLFDFEETKPISFGATAAQIQSALRSLRLVGTPAFVSVAGAAGSYTITFNNALGNVDQLVARSIPLMVDANGGDDVIRIQSVFEETFVQGGDEVGSSGGGNHGDILHLNVNATTGAPLTYAEITPDIGVSTTTAGNGSTNEVQQISLQDVTGGTFTLTFNGDTTAPIAWDAPPDAIRRALEALVGPGNITVARVGGNYSVEFREDYGHMNVPTMTANGANLRSNGVHAIITLDGEGGNDIYHVYLIGADTNSLVNVFDSGTEALNSLEVPLGPATTDSDKLTVYGTNNTFKPDVFLLRASTSERGLAFIAMINAADPHHVLDGDPVERVNYNVRLEQIVVEGRAGDDEFYVDDTRAIITINAGLGNDFIQVGQLYNSRRTPALSGVTDKDVFATIETTRGWLSNGISNPMTINGGDGEDRFIVFHNVAVLTLNGGADNDTFLVQAFALAGSQEDTRGLTDLSGDAGADMIQYAVNAPVNINGGDGFDTVIVIGTEFGDDFVITRSGVYGAGLNVNFINIEYLEVDGAEGDDRFFILSTGINFTTVVTGGLGTDLFSVEGPTPANGVISNDLLGHSGIITHSVESALPASQYAGLKVIGVGTNVQDNDEPSVIVTQTGGYSQVIENAAATETAQGIDKYSVVLGRPTLFGEIVTVTVAPPVGLVLLHDDLTTEYRDPEGGAAARPLTFDALNWWVPQWVYFKVDTTVLEIPDIGDIQHRITVSLNGTPSGAVVNAPSVDPTPLSPGDEYATLNAAGTPFLAPSAALPEGLRGAYVKITGGSGADEAAGQIRLILQSTASSLVLNKPWSVEPTGGALFEISLFSDVKIPNVRVRIYAASRPEIVLDQPGGDTSVAEGTSTGPAVDTIRVRLSAPVTSGTVTVTITGAGQLGFSSATLTFNSGNWNVFQTVTVTALDDAVVEGFHKADLALSASGNATYAGVTALAVADLADNDYPGVRIIETDGSTNVIEFDPVNHGVSEAQAIADGFPKSDSYSVVLTRAPQAGETVVVSVTSEPTRTSRTGGIRSFTEQVLVCVIGPGEPCTDPTHFSFLKTASFTSLNWDTPQIVVVRALDDPRVDGQDTQVFPPQLDLLNNIQGPLFIRGGLGDDRTGLFEREPVMLPGERNIKPSMGNVISAAGGPPATITIDPSSLRQIGIDTKVGGNATTAEVQELQIRATGGTFTLNFVGSTGPTAALPFNATALDIETALEAIGAGDVRVSQNSSIYKIEWAGVGNQQQLTANTAGLKPLVPADLVNFTIEITEGPAKNKSRIVTAAALAGANWILTLDKPWLSPFTGDATLPSASSKYTLAVTNPNLLVKEETSADILWVNDTDNPGSFNDPALTPNPFGIGRLFYETGLFGSKVSISTATNGGPGGASEVQRITVNATSGTYTLRFAGQQTAALAYNATAAQIQAALEALSTVGAGNVAVALDGDRFVVTYQGALAATDQPLLLVNQAGLVGGTALNKHRIVGFGMGADRIIGGAPQPGGITFEEIEDLRIDLGPGNNKFTIDQTHTGKTTVNTNGGHDEVYVKTISGHTFVNLGAGNDTLTITSDAQKLNQLLGLLTVSGDVPRAETVTLAKGSAAVPAESVAKVDEIQQVTIDATGGTFTLSLGGFVTSALAYNASAAAVQAALQALPSVGAGNVQVRKAGSVYRVTFVGALSGSDVALLSSNGSGLTNGAGAVDTLHIDDRATTADTWALLTSSSLTGLSLPQPNEIQQVVIDATSGTFTLSYGAQTTVALAWNAAAAAVQSALEALSAIGAGNVAVTRNDDVYVIRFQGELTNTDATSLVVNAAGLQKAVEQLGGAVTTGAGSGSATTRTQGGTTVPINDVQVLTVNATGGTYSLSLLNGILNTASIAFDASSEVVRQAIQDAIAQGDVFAALKFDVTVEKYANVYVIGFQGCLRQLERRRRRGLPGRRHEPRSPARSRSRPGWTGSTTTASRS